MMDSQEALDEVLAAARLPKQHSPEAMPSELVSEAAMEAKMRRPPEVTAKHDNPMTVETIERRDPWWLGGKIQVCTLCVMAAIFLLLLMYVFRMAYRIGGCDFKGYLSASKSLWEGGNPYQVETSYPYLYPLFLAFVLIPLTFIPYGLATVSWFVLCVASLVGACLSLQRIASCESRTAMVRYLPTAGLISMFLLFQPILCGFPQGQVNPIVLLCTALFYGSYARNRPLRAGAWLGAAIAIKVVPAVLVVFLIVRRQYRILLWTLLFTVLFCTLPVIIVGKGLPAYYQSYLNAVVWPSMAHTMANSRTHYSFAGSLACILPTVPGIWLKIIAGLIVTAGLLAVELAAVGFRRPSRDIWCFCGYLVGCLALSPVVELHHFVLAAPAVFLLTVKTIVDHSWTTRAVGWWMGAFVACFVVAVEWDETKLAYFASLIILLVLLFLANRHQQVTLGTRKETQVGEAVASEHGPFPSLSAASLNR